MPPTCAAAVEMEWIAFGQWLIRVQLLASIACRLSPVTPSGLELPRSEPAEDGNNDRHGNNTITITTCTIELLDPNYDIHIAQKLFCLLSSRA